MGKIGLIGGMSYESTGEYYRIINELVNKRLGGLHSAEIGMESVDFAKIEVLQRQGKWNELEMIMIELAQRLEKAGADCIVICTNTMHKTAPAVQGMIGIPLIHIADATAQKIKEKGLKKALLLGTQVTMEEDFYKRKLIVEHGIEVVIPTIEEMRLIDDVIFNELCRGVIDWHRQVVINRIIELQAAKGAECVILGCTELPLLINQKSLNKQLGSETAIPLFDTTNIHAEAAVNFALDG
ncbi:MAG: aspartate/glutamate racemase family protein [Candidatus Pacebacteria bacterium]|nr:aspartate/glutamate racemase family protein [Candidatus Paceibacterota bacterium]